MRNRLRERATIARLLRIIAAVVVVLLLRHLLTQPQRPVRVAFKNPLNLQVDQTCRIPELDINRTEVIYYYEKIAPLDCGNRKDWVYVDKSGRVQLSDYARKTYGMDVSCSFEYVIRKDDYDHHLTPGEEDIIGKRPTQSDFFWIHCRSGWYTWKNLFMTVVKNDKHVDSLKTKKKPKNWSGLNVYMFGLDSLSQMAFRRSLPKTVKYFEESMKGVVLNGYNIVGDGTPQALIPILTSKTEIELPQTRKRYADAKSVDVYPWIWNNFSDAGYATMFGEDMAEYGAFSYRLNGFKNQPTDHYVRTFFQEAEKVFGRTNVQCIGSEPMHKLWIDYGNSFINQYSSISWFQFLFHGVLSHDDINLVQVMDDDLAGNLEFLQTSGALNNSIVILMADHGHRFAKLRNTHQGQLEERLPFFGIALPEAFRTSKRGIVANANLQSNANRLSTPFDIHQTLMDVLHWPDDLQEIQSRSVRSHSLFRPIPKDRACADAGVEPHWCTCLAWESVLDDVYLKKQAMNLAQAVVDEINALTEPERKLCAKLALSTLFEAKRLAPDSSLMKYNGVNDADGFEAKLEGGTQVSTAYYQLKFETTPGNAIYEATVLHDLETNVAKVDQKAISHVNKYGDKPHCIIDKNYFLATYCICYDKMEVGE